MFDSKQLRTEKKIFKKLKEKFEKAFLIEYYQAATDTFTIDNKFVIVCNMYGGRLDVSRKDTTEKIISIDCAQYADDPDAQKKSKLLREFFQFAKTMADDFVIKQQANKKQLNAAEAASKAQAQKRIYMAKLTKALSKLK